MAIKNQREPAPRLGAPAARATSGGSPPPVEATAWALAIHRGGLGFELSRPLQVGPLTLRALDVTLPGLSFPLDVTGGLARFRHRRGSLQGVELELAWPALETWLSSELRGLLDPARPQVQLAVEGRGAEAVLRLTVVGQASLATAWLQGVEAQRPRPVGERGHDPRWASGPVPTRVLVCELGVDADGEALRVHLRHARGAGLDTPPSLLALALLEAVARAAGAKRQGASLRFEAPARALGRSLLPAAGLRAPDASPFCWDVVELLGDALFVRGSRSADLPQRAAHAEVAEKLSWRESLRLLGDADDALFVAWNRHMARSHEPVAPDLREDAWRDVRERLLGLLERAPKHPELLRRLAELDALAAVDRAEAASATLRERPLGPLGDLPARLAAAAGDESGRLAALVHEAAQETSPALAAELFLHAAGCATNLDDALRFLDLALAHVPAHRGARAARLARRLQAGLLAEARADAEHLEALSHEGRERFELLLTLAHLHAAAQHGAAAAGFFERALRQCPDDPLALFGLGDALADSGRLARGASLVARAIDALETPTKPGSRGAARRKAARLGDHQADLGGDDTKVLARMRLRLAALLADGAGDEPAAIARLRLVDDQGMEGARARALEGRYRARLGDRAGASLAYARLREVARTLEASHALELAEALAEAAQFEEEQRGDWAAAERHLAAAVALAPRASALRAAYQRVASGVPNATVARIEEPTPPTPRVPPAAAARLDSSASPLAEQAALPTAPPRASQHEPLDLDAPLAADELAAHELAATAERPAARPGLLDLGGPPSTPAGDVDDELLAEDLHHKFLLDPHDVAVQSAYVAVLDRLGRGMELLALVSGMLEDAGDDAAREALRPVHRRVLESLETAARAAGNDAEADLYRMVLQQG